MATDGLPDLNIKPSTLNLICRSPIGLEKTEICLAQEDGIWGIWGSYCNIAQSHVLST